MSPVLLSAHNPMTGPRHLGHLVSTMVDWPKLEEKYEIFIVIDDLIASLLYPKGREQIQARVFNVAREFFATGIHRQKSHVVLTSMIPELHELTFFMGSLIDFQWLRELYTESFGGLLGSFQRYQLGLNRLASATEVVYPQVALAAMTLGLGTDAFQGGEEMRGYLHIMEAISERAGRSSGIRAPQFLPGRATFLLGTDGRHMASENAIYLAAPKEELQRDIGCVRSAEIFRNWYGALEQKKSTREVSDPLAADTTRTMLDYLLERLKPFREFKMSNADIADALEQSALLIRERLSERLAGIKKEFGIPGFV
jgi:tryptophanyl-tRNA synthetase